MLLGVPNLLVGVVYYVKNEGCLLEVFIMRLFNQTLSMYDQLSVLTFLFFASQLLVELSLAHMSLRKIAIVVEVSDF